VNRSRRRPDIKRVLFVCSQNKLRSPTAEQVFSTWENIEVSSAGTNNDACNPLDGEQIEWADIIFVMEKAHRAKILRKYKKSLNGKRIVCLDIPDDYEYMDPALIRILEAKIPKFL
jgi:predicted protein tyrosine phosphatase